MVAVDVVIIGCGPVGALLANFLGERGIDTLVLDQAKEIHQLPRALGFDDEVKRAFQAAGLDTSFGRSAISLKGMDLLVKAGGKLLRRFDIQDQPQRLGHPLSTTFYQPELEAVIRGGLDRYSDLVQLRLGERVTSIEDLGEQVRVEFVNVDTQTCDAVAAKFIVGCDGGRSMVRKFVDSPLEDMGLHQPWLVVDVIMKKEMDMDRWAQQICDASRPATFVPSPPPRNRFEFMLMDGDNEELMTKPERVEELIRPWLDSDAYEIERSAVYTFHALLTTEMRHGRILLSGDAAHQMPPFLGQGMCAGIRDVFNLAWKLDFTIRGISDQVLLDTYSTERVKHIRHVIDTAVRIGKIIQAPSRVLGIVRNAAMRIGEMLGMDIRHLTMSQEPLGPGFFSDTGIVPEDRRYPFPQPRVRETSDGDPILLDETLGLHFTLVTRIGANLRDRHPLVKLLEVVGPDSESNPHSTVDKIYDVDGVITEWLNETGCDALLLRPDRVPFGIYSGAGAAIPLILEDLFSRLGNRAEVKNENTILLGGK